MIEATRTLSAKSTKSTKSINGKECASRSDTAFGIGEFTEEVVDGNDNENTAAIKDVKKGAGTIGLVKPEVWKPEMSTSSGEESKDVVKEYVQQEEEKIAKRRAKNLPLKFRDLKPVSVARNRAKMQGGQSSGIPVRTTTTSEVAAAAAAAAAAIGKSNFKFSCSTK